MQNKVVFQFLVECPTRFDLLNSYCWGALIPDSLRAGPEICSEYIKIKTYIDDTRTLNQVSILIRPYMKIWFFFIREDIINCTFYRLLFHKTRFNHYSFKWKLLIQVHGIISVTRIGLIQSHINDLILVFIVVFSFYG